jgi:hypothetical protein
MLTLLAVWAWVKKYWKIILGVFGVILGFLFGFKAKKVPVVVTGVDPLKTKEESQTAAAVAAAQTQHDTVVAHDQAQAVAEDAAVVKQETVEVAKVEDNVDATNQYLQSVSKELNGPTGGTGG